MRKINIDEFRQEKKDYSPTSYENHLLEQYKIMIESTERVSDRRNSYNSFLLSIHTILISILGYLVTHNLDSTSMFTIFIGFLGIVLSVFWIVALNNYRRLNSGKFEVINLIEKELPIQLYKLEWNILEYGSRRSNYLKNSKIEKVIPITFIIAYFFIFLSQFSN